MLFLQKIWKWLLLSAAVIGGVALTYFAGGSKSRDQQNAAVDAAKSADTLKAAQDQADTANAKMAQLVSESDAWHLAINGQRASLAAGKVDTRAIDEQLREAGILK